MCVIIYKPENIVIPKWILKASNARNSDGMGLAYFDHGDVCVKKGFFHLTELQYHLEALENKQCVLHFRRATMGDVSTEACHPFLFGNNAFAHNGTIHKFKKIARKFGSEYSDTQVLNKILIRNNKNPHDVFNQLSKQKCGRFVWLDSKSKKYRFYGKWHELAGGLLFSTLSWINYAEIKIGGKNTNASICVR